MTNPLAVDGQGVALHDDQLVEVQDSAGMHGWDKAIHPKLIGRQHRILSMDYSSYWGDWMVHTSYSAASGQIYGTVVLARWLRVVGGLRTLVRRYQEQSRG